MMKRRFLALCLLLITIIFARADSQQASNDPILIIVLMVKNEASVIRETLKPFVDVITQNTENNNQQKLAFFIFDTGSTDGTIPVTKKYFEENHVQHATIQEEPFIDFATSRNHALERAQSAYPTATFMLMLDAEWYMNNVQGLLEFCQAHKTDTCNSYLVRIMNTYIDFYTPRLVRCKSGVHFVGVVHEVLSEVSFKKVSPDCFFEWRAGNLGREKSQARWLRDLNLLLKEHEKNPHDPRTAFYIAQTYHCLDDLTNARTWYERRSLMPGWSEENFVARYRLAQICEALGDWTHAQSHYTAAFSLRPCRAEPLIKLAEHYLKTNELDLCYLYSRRAVEIPYPENDILLIDKDLYNYTRYDLLGISAWYVGEYELGKQAVMHALLMQPEDQRLKSNLNFYLMHEAKSCHAR